VKHRADGGETSLANCVNLCGWHHRLVHEGGWTMGWDREGRAIVFDPRGGMQSDGRWQPPELDADAVAALIRENAERGIEPDGSTASARWERGGNSERGLLRGERCDVSAGETPAEMRDGEGAGVGPR
jgi:hypothetical protein